MQVYALDMGCMVRAAGIQVSGSSRASSHATASARSIAPPFVSIRGAMQPVRIHFLSASTSSRRCGSSIVAQASVVDLLPRLAHDSVSQLSGSLALGSSPSPLAVTSFAPTQIYYLAEGLEQPVQLLYLLTLLGFLMVGAFVVVRQVLIRRELEEAAKVLGERIRTGSAGSEDYFELGVILLRKKLYTQATKNLERAKKTWQGEPEELAQVHNALGYAYFQVERNAAAIEEYKAAVELQPGYVTAWNNLGDVYEKQRQYKPALDAYNQALAVAPENKVAVARAEYCKTRVERIELSK